MYKFQRVDNTNIGLIENFLLRLGEGSSSFRYFVKRPVEVVLEHLLTVVILDQQEIPLAYGHLDKENDDLWLGVAVVDEARGFGLGKKMLQYLIEKARLNGEKSIKLAVDKSNAIAIRLYESHGFLRSAEEASYYKYTLSL